MSHFVEYKTEFRDPFALIAALVECGFAREHTAQQAQIATQLAALDQLIATLGGTAGGHPIRSSPPAARAIAS